jgi:predicted nucleotidyltransferase
MNTFDRLQLMLASVAQALGDELLQRVAFVGGCVVGLLLTDTYSRQQVRTTDDVDLIVDVVSYAEYTQLEKHLRSRGFVVSMQDEINCRWRLGGLIVDVMPANEKILGYSNRWYRQALATAEWHGLTGGARLRVVRAPYFLGTKLDAYKGRGGGDLLSSRDIEDLLNLVDGRESLVDELAEGEAALRDYVATEVAGLLEHKDIEYAVQSVTNGNADRGEVLFERMTDIAQLRI